MKFNTLYKQHNRSDWFETPVGDSMTEPDQSLSVQEIMRRFTAGTLREEDIARSDVGEGNDDIDNPTPRILDLTDIEDLSRSYDDAVARANSEIAQSKVSNANEKQVADNDSAFPQSE